MKGTDLTHKNKVGSLFLLLVRKWTAWITKNPSASPNQVILTK